MADPTATVRLTPQGSRLMDGFRSLITTARDSQISFWEVDVQPPGIDGGDPIDTTTMHNILYRTKTSRALMELTDVAVTAAYDPQVLEDIIDQINAETSWTVTFSNSDQWVFYGYLRSFTPQPMVEGEMPLADIVIVCTNYDPDNCVEAGPIFINGNGTCDL